MISFFMLLTMIFLGAGYTNNNIINEIDDKEERAFRYVAEDALGDGSGMSAADAADLLDQDFWMQVHQDLKSSSVEVKLCPGEYKKAFINNGLKLEGIGNIKNRLLITGGDQVLLHVLEDYPHVNYFIHLNDCQNIHIRDLHFTGHGSVNYVLVVQSSRSSAGPAPSRNILFENCSWIDMNGIIYGATGCHSNRTTNITYKNCTFKRIGSTAKSHMMYHANGSSNISVVDCHFEDCTGEYVRFRNRSDFGLVQNCVFIRNDSEKYPPLAFISIPCYNDVDPGDEHFGTNYIFTGNQFTNMGTEVGSPVIYFHHNGFSPKDYQYLLNVPEALTLITGLREERIALLKNHFGIETNKILISNNILNGPFINYVGFYSAPAYGAVSRGWKGRVDITDLVLDQVTYLVYVTSQVYSVDQVDYVISSRLAQLTTETLINEFVSYLTPSMGATMAVIDKNGEVKTSGDLNDGDKLVVTSADGKISTIYSLDMGLSSAKSAGNQQHITIFPNPASDTLHLQGLEAGNCIQIYNAFGVLIREVMAHSNLESISLESVPSGMFLIVISDNGKPLGNFKAIRK